MAGVVVRNAAGVPADVPPGTRSDGLPPKPAETLGYLPARSQLVLFNAAPLDYLPAQVRYVPAATFVSHVIHTATAGGPPDMTTTGDTPPTAATSATSATTAQA